MADDILHLARLAKGFDGVPVLKGISADVYRGDVVGLLGLNGAGKTTLLETALGFAVPDEGSVELFGQPSSALADENLKHRIGFVPQQDELLEQVKGSEYLSLISKFYPRWNADLIRRLASDWDVPLGVRIYKLSVGQRQKLSILTALGHEPELIVLDEPVASLDPLARRKFLQELIDIVSDGRRTILFSTHIVSDLERIARSAGRSRRPAAAHYRPVPESIRACRSRRSFWSCTVETAARDLLVLLQLAAHDGLLHDQRRSNDRRGPVVARGIIRCEAPRFAPGRRWHDVRERFPDPARRHRVSPDRR